MTTVIIPFICVIFLSSQSLVEVAKKEKERRAKIKKKSSKVVTNADLKKGTQTVSVKALSDQEIEDKETTPDSESESEKKTGNPEAKKTGVKKDFAGIKRLEKSYEEAKEHVELLLKKMDALWQKYNNPGDVTPKDRVRSEIAHTYLRLQKAQQDAAEAKDKWEAETSKKNK